MHNLNTFYDIHHFHRADDKNEAPPILKCVSLLQFRKFKTFQVTMSRKKVMILKNIIRSNKVMSNTHTHSWESVL